MRELCVTRLGSSGLRGALSPAWDRAGLAMFAPGRLGWRDVAAGGWELRSLTWGFGWCIVDILIPAEREREIYIYIYIFFKYR